ncbi:hypothetical protein BGP_1452 [Beggiatoa sp. PS]|nr:hypothetical protein BGP_1452 [Beggiatoa sp. PS]
MSFNQCPPGQRAGKARTINEIALKVCGVCMVFFFSYVWWFVFSTTDLRNKRIDKSIIVGLRGHIEISAFIME